MRIRTFESFWLIKNGLLYSYPSLDRPLHSEIVVLGGGITGALVSHALLEKGYEVTLLDQKDIGMGSTAATTSMLQYEIDTPLVDLVDMIGEDAAVSCYQAGLSAIHKLRKLVGELAIDCGFKSKNSLYFAHSKEAAVSLKKEFRLRDKYKLGVKWLSSPEIRRRFGIKSYGGILSDTAASLDAYRLAHELIHRNSKRGLRVFDQTQIEELNLNQPNPDMLTKDGHKIGFKTVVFCTGFESVRMLKENIATVFHTYATVSEQGITVKPDLEDTLLWNTSNPYLYLRTTDDKRLLIGGEDSSHHIPFFQQKIKERKSEALQKKIADLMPEVDFKEDFSWGGTFGSTKDGLPYIGRSPEYDHSLFVLGFGGNGITFSVQAMDIIPDLLEGKTPQLAAYYRFGR